MPVWCLIALLSLPFAIKAIKGARQYRDMNQLIPALGSNVIFIMLTHILIGVGYILDKAF
jgi:1,4-dihydroxy-2-naphthoate octaprenyltransferase